MRKLLFAALAALVTFTVNADVWQAEYGVARSFDFALFNADGSLDVDEVDAGTEVTLDCNGTPATATNDFADEGSFYSIALTAAELQCERVTVTVAATLTSVFHVETFGNAAAFNETLGWLTGDAFARLGAPAGASHAADLLVIDNFVDGLEAALGTPSDVGGGATFAANLVTIEAQTDDIGAAGAGLTALASQSSLDTLDNLVDTEVADIRRAIGPASTTIATLASQTSFTLTAGSADDNAYNGYGLVIVDASTAAQSALGCVSDYTGSTKTVTLRADPAVFTMATSDVAILLPSFCTTGVDVTTIETIDATDQLDTHAAAGLDAAGVRTAVGLASANLDTQLTAIDDAVDTEVAAILVDTGTTLDDFLDTEVAAILADTDEVQTSLAAGGLIESLVDDIGVAGAGLTAVDDTLVTTIGAAGAGLTAVAIGTGGIAAGDFGAGAITAASTAADFSTEVQDADVESVNGVTILGDGSVTPFGVSYRQFKRSFPDAEMTRAAFRAMRDQAFREYVQKNNGFTEASLR